MSIDFDSMTKFLQSLVQTQTLSGQEKPGIDLIAAEMHRLGYDQVTTDAYGNLIGLINGAHAGPTLLFDAHLDTVSIAPGVPWQHDPFGADIQDDRMYGRGTTDMKGPLVAILYAAAAAKKANLAGRIVVSASVMEEVIEGLLLEPIVSQFQPDFVIIGEPTNLNLNCGGRGRAEILLEAIGRPVHSSTPQLGVNAVLLMVAAIQAIEKLTLPTAPSFGPAVMALTDIISEPYPGHSMTPSRCRVTYDRRLLPGETEKSVLATLQELPELAQVKVMIAQAEYTTYTGTTLCIPKFFPAWQIDSNHNFVQSALAGLRAAGLDPVFGVYQFNTNATYTAGILDIPTIGFGPSPESQAHIVDEYIELADLRAATRGYLSIIQSVLKVNH